MKEVEACCGNRDVQTFAIIGAAIEVHHVLGRGFLEAVYQDALEAEFISKGIQYERERKLPVVYKGQILASSYRVDFLCYANVPVELKALARLSGVEESQLINYLKASGMRRGLLLNFGAASLECRRFAVDGILGEGIRLTAV
jgi:GxxExxY protein